MEDISHDDVLRLAYFLEGEGSFGSYRVRDFYLPQVSAYSNDLDVLERIGRITGKKVHEVKRKKRNEKHGRSHSLHAFGQEAIQLMMLVYPHMGARRQKQIEVALIRYMYERPTTS